MTNTMELNLNELYKRTLRLSEALSHIPLRVERVRGAKGFKELTLREALAFLKDFESLSQSKEFSQKELGLMLGNTCLEVGSFLFSAGAADDVWREWCSLSGLSFYLGADLSYAMQLLTIARATLDDGIAAALRDAKLQGYREQAVQFIIFRSSKGKMPALPAPTHPLDMRYQDLIASMELAPAVDVTGPISRIVEYWLDETSYGTFEPGVFPVFEPEINSSVVALIAQGFALRIQSSRIRKFLCAALT
jgi:hypothetical protein